MSARCEALVPDRQSGGHNGGLVLAEHLVLAALIFRPQQDPAVACGQAFGRRARRKHRSPELSGLWLGAVELPPDGVFNARSRMDRFLPNKAARDPAAEG